MSYLYNPLAQLPVLYTVTELMIPYLKFTADMQQYYLHGITTSVQESTKFTPFFLMEDKQNFPWK